SEKPGGFLYYYTLVSFRAAKISGHAASAAFLHAWMKPSDAAEAACPECPSPSGWALTADRCLCYAFRFWLRFGCGYAALLGRFPTCQAVRSAAILKAAGLSWWLF